MIMEVGVFLNEDLINGLFKSGMCRVNFELGETQQQQHIQYMLVLLEFSEEGRIRERKIERIQREKLREFLFCIE